MKLRRAAENGDSPNGIKRFGFSDPQGHVFVEFKAPRFEIKDSLPQFSRLAER